MKLVSKMCWTLQTLFLRCLCSSILNTKISLLVYEIVSSADVGFSDASNHMEYIHLNNKGNYKLMVIDNFHTYSFVVALKLSGLIFKTGLDLVLPGEFDVTSLKCKKKRSAPCKTFALLRNFLMLWNAAPSLEAKSPPYWGR